MGAPGRCQAIDDQINWSQVAADDFQGLLFDVVGKGIAVNAGCVKSIAPGGIVKRHRIVISGRGRFASFRRTLKEYAESARAKSPGGRDSAGESITCGCAD